MNYLARQSTLFPAEPVALKGVSVGPSLVDGPPVRRALIGVTPPPRLNFAGFCDFCCLRGCLSDECVRRYRDTWWAVCQQCVGEGCESCLWGVVQVHPGTPGAVHP